jgi:hypothetical protein
MLRFADDTRIKGRKLVLFSMSYICYSEIRGTNRRIGSRVPHGIGSAGIADGKTGCATNG